VRRRWLEKALLCCEDSLEFEESESRVIIHNCIRLDRIIVFSEVLVDHLRKAYTRELTPNLVLSEFDS